MADIQVPPIVKNAAAAAKELNKRLGEITEAEDLIKALEPFKETLKTQGLDLDEGLKMIKTAKDMIAAVNRAAKT